MVIHWDEVEGTATDLGELRGTWRRLGRAAGAIGVGANRVDLPPGGRSTPVHTHTAEAEIFYVLGGDASAVRRDLGRAYPRSAKLVIPGLRASFRVEPVDVWDGEA